MADAAVSKDTCLMKRGISKNEIRVAKSDIKQLNSRIKA
jgi:hypothetical protein